jgi:hypothetical protein
VNSQSKVPRNANSSRSTGPVGVDGLAGAVRAGALSVPAAGGDGWATAGEAGSRPLRRSDLCVPRQLPASGFNRPRLGKELGLLTSMARKMSLRRNTQQEFVNSYDEGF